MLSFLEPRIYALCCFTNILYVFQCIGTDKNISDWILIRRCEILYRTLEFFHSNLGALLENEETNASEKIANAMEVYLPAILYAGNILGNSPTIRLPKVRKFMSKNITREPLFL